jgi:tetratricopeptide (TPR) repeat protein
MHISQKNNFIERPSGRNMKINCNVTNILSVAENQLKNGDHLASLTTINRINHAFSEFDNVRLQATKSLIVARNYIHLNEDEKALYLLDNIDPNVVSISKSVAATLNINKGLIFKRKGYALWKNGNSKAALTQLNKAIDLFSNAQYEAELGAIELIKYNAQLNSIYTKSLIILIQGENIHEKFDALLVEAIVCESDILANSTPKNLDHLTGLTIIADMCDAVKKTPQELLTLSTSPKFLKAYYEMFNNQTSWSKHLLDEASKGKSRPDVYAKALILGAKMIASNDIELVKLYALRLYDALLIVQHESQRETVLTRAIRLTLDNLPKEHSMRISRKTFL